MTIELPGSGKFYEPRVYEAIDQALKANVSLRGKSLRAIVETALGERIDCPDKHWDGEASKFVDRFLKTGTSMPERMAKKLLKLEPGTTGTPIRGDTKVYVIFKDGVVHTHDDAQSAIRTINEHEMAEQVWRIIIGREAVVNKATRMIVRIEDIILPE